MNVDGQKLADLVALGVKRLVEPLIARVKALEARDQSAAALEARVRLLEQRLGADHTDADPLGGS